ncbi:MAG: hypothetical protein CM15mP117_03750 [Alphaproteobacteria bacterium]|nr:MAG: hypothetical protein CM15mP117_03750 [Alphaproteobacteria bacterium]
MKKKTQILILAGCCWLSKSRERDETQTEKTSEEDLDVLLKTQMANFKTAGDSFLRNLIRLSVECATEFQKQLKKEIIQKNNNALEFRIGKQYG